MFPLWNHSRTPRKAGRARYRLCLEALEDRCVLSTMGMGATAFLPFTGTAPIITAAAGQTFSGVLATVTPSDSSTLTATIAWGDGHVSAGVLTPNQQTIAIAGSNVFAQPGWYQVVVTIGAKAAGAATSTIRITALVSASASNYATGGLPGSVYFGDSNVAASADDAGTVSLVTNSAPGRVLPPSGPAVTTTQSQPASTNSPVPQPPPPTLVVVANSSVPQSPPPSVFVPMVSPPLPIRVSSHEYLSWSSVREQGLNSPLSASAFQALPQEQPLSMPRTAQASAAAATLVTFSTSTAPTTPKSIDKRPDQDADVPAGATFVLAGTGAGAGRRNKAAPAEDTPPDRGTADQEEYQQPLYRIADRGELAGSIQVGARTGLDASLSAAPFPPIQRSRRDDELDSSPQALEPMHFAFKATPRADASGCVMEAVAAWAVFQALHAPEVQAFRTLPREDSRRVPNP